MSEISSQNSTVKCGDGHPIAITTFTPKQSIKAAIFIAPATGIKRQFYNNFAQYLANNQYAVITFDNRGIGQSLSGKLKDNEASLQCWGEQDMPAVFNHLRVTFPGTKYHLLGHSAGGQLVGLMPNGSDLSSMFNVASSSGYMKNMQPLYKIQAKFFLNFFSPISNKIFGATNSHWFGMGEPLPKHVARQWGEWCRGGGYVKTAFGKSVKSHIYDSLNIPSKWVHAIDDDIANTANVADMLSVFTNLIPEVLTLTPKDHSLKEIGHMKFFSRKSQCLWPIALEWLNKHSD